MYEIISGAILMACLVTGIFFYRFWKRTQDKLFVMFAAAFWLLGVERLVLGYVGAHNEPSPTIYLIRLSAFILILLAIIIKNSEGKRED